jgi:class 3 adenylate cyclase
MPDPSGQTASTGDLADDELGSPALSYYDHHGARQLHRLAMTDTVTIGRSEEAGVSLPWDPSVSSTHAEMVFVGAGWMISDEGISRNGTFVNEERVKGRRRLRHGDVIRVGRTRLAFNDQSGGGRDATTVIDDVGETATATILFTDLAGSTELLDRIGDDAGDRFVRDHFAILRRAINEHGGREVKSLGDGLMVAFPGAASAIACASAMQRAFAAYAQQAGAAGAGIRIGVNAGEVISAEGDYFGTPVVVAKRLCDQAASGQTLVSGVVRALVGPRREHRFLARGELRLKGLADPVEVFELDRHAVGAGTPQRIT